MYSLDSDFNFDEQYTNINIKLKKRFLKKPNLTEAANEFVGLAMQCENCEQHSKAGQAYVGAGKCESSAGNFLAEAKHYLSAAREYIKAEMKFKAIAIESPDSEDIESAICCYMHALNKYPADSPLRTSILMELANNLCQLDKKSEAVHYYKMATERLDQNSMIRLNCLNKIIHLYISCGCYDEALTTANTLCDSEIKIPNNMLADIQVTRILLCILLHLPEEKRCKSLQKIMKDVTSENDDADLPFNVDMKLKLHSIMICVENKDVPSLNKILFDVRQYFTIDQEDLLLKLLRNLDNGLYYG